jgi:hypothetical protein
MSPSSSKAAKIPEPRGAFPQIFGFTHRYHAFSHRISSMTDSRLTECTIESWFYIQPDERGDQ